MAKKLITLLGVAAFFMAAPRASASDMWAGVGAKFSWDNYEMPIMLYQDGGPQIETAKFGGPRYGGNFQWGVSKQLVLHLSVDFNVFKYKIYPFPGTDEASQAPKAEASFFTLGGLLGAKFYFRAPEPERAVLYLTAGVGGYVGKGSAKYDQPENTTVDDAVLDAGKDALEKQVDVIARLASPFVFQVAVGAEFWATDSFAIGADILGLRLSYASAQEGQLDNSALEGATYSGDISALRFGVYSSLTMTFNLSAGGSQKEEPVEEVPAQWGQQPAQDEGWGGGWSTAPAPAPVQPAPAPQQQPAPAEPPAGGQGWEAAPPPPPPPPPAPQY